MGMQMRVCSQDMQIPRFASIIQENPSQGISAPVRETYTSALFASDFNRIIELIVESSGGESQIFDTLQNSRSGIYLSENTLFPQT
jgi:hypothetical protein